MQTQTNNISTSSPAQRHRRRGTTTVEFALVALPLFLFLFGSIEFGRSMMAMQSLEEAARTGCRLAILDGAESKSVESAIDDVLAGNGISVYTVDIDPAPLKDTQRWTPVTVSITTTFEEISWLPAPMYFKGMTYTASCTLPREANSND